METINYVSVLVAALAQFAVGGVWYSPALFSHKWLAAMGKTPENYAQNMPKGMWKTFVTSFVGSLLMAYVFAHTVAAFDGRDVGAGLVGGFFMFLGFAFPIMLNNYLYEGSLRPNENRKKLMLISGGYYLVSLLVMGAILAAWR